MKNDHIHIKIESDVKAELQKIAKSLGLSLSAFLVMSAKTFSILDKKYNNKPL